MRIDVFTDPILGHVGPVPITRTMASSVFTSVLIVLSATSLSRAVRLMPDSRMAAAGRLTYGFLHDLVVQTAGRESRWLEAFAGTLFLFIAGAAVVGQLPDIPAPTSSLPATGALAVLVFLAVPFAGIQAKGVAGYLKSYFRPNPLLFPLHLISELSRTLALALRLFGNMLSGNLVVAVIVSLVGLILPVPLMALDLLIGILQAYIFTVLACVYVGAAIQIEEGI